MRPSKQYVITYMDEDCTILDIVRMEPETTIKDILKLMLRDGEKHWPEGAYQFSVMLEDEE